MNFQTNTLAPAHDDPSPGAGAFSLENLRQSIHMMAAASTGAAREGHILESSLMVDLVEDWSKARSPSRTRRRMRYNAARIRTYVPQTHALRMPDGTLVMHPAMAARVRQALGVPGSNVWGSAATNAFGAWS
jgi:hypothetical protein